MAFPRLASLLTAVMFAGCVTPTATTISTDRLLMTSTPVAPLALAGGSGLALGLTMLPVGATTSRADGATAYATVQPELSGLVQLGHATAVSARFSVSSPALGVKSQPSPVTLTADAIAITGTLGMGHDFSAAERRWGGTLSGELGFTGSSLAVSAARMPTRVTSNLLPLLTGAAGVWVSLGPATGEGPALTRPIRLYAGGSVGTTATNDAFGTQTTLCSGCTSISETGTIGLGAIAMIGGGARWQIVPAVSVGVEGWGIVQSSGTSVPFVASATIRVGQFEPVLSRPARVRVPEAPAMNDVIESAPEPTDIPPPL